MKKATLTFANQTLREIVRVSIGGSLIRVRLSNAYGKEAVEIGAAHVALRRQDSALIPGSDRALTFSGQSKITIPPNALLLSDPIALDVPPSSDLAISIFLPKPALGAGIHYSAEQTNYAAAGDLTSAPSLPNASTLGSWVFLTGIDVAAPQSASTLVAFGDSISGVRWSDRFRQGR
jgi:hypothetical protein